MLITLAERASEIIKNIKSIEQEMHFVQKIIDGNLKLEKAILFCSEGIPTILGEFMHEIDYNLIIEKMQAKVDALNVELSLL